MSVPGQVKESKSKKDFGKTRQQKQSPAQKKLEEKTLKYGPYILGPGVGALGVKAVAKILASKNIKSGATLSGLRKAANKIFGKKEVDAAMTPTAAARKKLLSQDRSRTSDKPPTTKKPKTKEKREGESVFHEGKGGKLKPAGKIAIGLGIGSGAVNYGSRIARELAEDNKISGSAKKSIDGQSGDSRSAPRKDLGDKEPSSRKDSSSKDNKPAAPKKNTTPKKRTKISDSGGREDAKEKNKTRKLKTLEQGRRRFGDLVVDSTNKGMQTDDDEMRRNKGGAIKKTYGMRAGGFTKRGGMYKKGY
jgi:hypothetical protein